MSDLDNFYNKIICRIGLRSELLSIVMESGEIGFSQDVSTFSVGDGTTIPIDIVGTKSTLPFDLTTSPKITLPGNIVFDKTKPGQVNGVDLASINNSNGIIIRTGDNKFGSASVQSSDNSIVIDGGDGSTGSIDLALNLNNDALLKLINNGGYVLYVGSSPPNNPVSGSDFFDSDEDILYKRIGDATTGAWVDYSS